MVAQAALGSASEDPADVTFSHRQKLGPFLEHEPH